MSQDSPEFPTSLDGLDLAQLESLRDRMDVTLKSLAREERKTALEQIHALIAQFDFLPFEVFPSKNQAPKAALPAKYYDPDSGQSWSGRGKTPRWLEGKDKVKYLIQKEGLLQAMEDAGFLAENSSESVQTLS